MTAMGIIKIPRRIKGGRAFTGIKHGDDLMAMYGPDGRLTGVFDSAREVDLIVAPSASDGPVTRRQLAQAEVRPFGDEELSGFTYFVGGDTGPIKIGRAVNVAVRFKDIQACSPVRLSVLAVRQGGERERLYHRLFADARVHGEWFARTPAILAEIARLNATRPADLGRGA